MDDDFDYGDEYGYVEEIFDLDTGYRGAGVELGWNEIWWEINSES